MIVLAAREGGREGRRRRRRRRRREEAIGMNRAGPQDAGPEDSPMKLMEYFLFMVVLSCMACL